ncbi:MAG: DUF6340 family protein [Bacteroidetes bacterium]|nr:DUF6340 family protein [Bacteroidota bacterium]
MKTNYYLFIICVSILSSSCSKYGYVQLKYPTQPNAVIPDNIKTIAVVNRSLSPKDTKSKGNAITEAILTGEIAGSDKLASDECIKAVFDGLNGYKGITIVFPATSRLIGTGTRATPDPLDWSRVKQICDSTKADALLVLEMFDSNSDLLLSGVTNQINNVLSGTIDAPKPPSQIRMNVSSYWRMYDPLNQKIIDQFQTSNYLTFNSTGILNIPPPEALPQTAYAAGGQYVNRFIPGYYYVKREMFKRGKGAYKQQFKTGFRKSEVADWEGAILVWNDIADKSSGKNAGRACLNLAVGYEVLGKTEEALKWAKKSYEDYGNKLGREYANQLKYRINIE